MRWRGRTRDHLNVCLTWPTKDLGLTVWPSPGNGLTKNTWLCYKGCVGMAIDNDYQQSLEGSFMESMWKHDHHLCTKYVSTYIFSFLDCGVNIILWEKSACLQPIAVCTLVQVADHLDPNSLLMSASVRVGVLTQKVCIMSISDS